MELWLALGIVNFSYTYEARRCTPGTRNREASPVERFVTVNSVRCDALRLQGWLAGMKLIAGALGAK